MLLEYCWGYFKHESTTICKWVLIWLFCDRDRDIWLLCSTLIFKELIFHTSGRLHIATNFMLKWACSSVIKNFAVVLSHKVLTFLSIICWADHILVSPSPPHTHTHTSIILNRFIAKSYFYTSKFFKSICQDFIFPSCIRKREREKMNAISVWYLTFQV